MHFYNTTQNDYIMQYNYQLATKLYKYSIFIFCGFSSRGLSSLSENLFPHSQRIIFRNLISLLCHRGIKNETIQNNINRCYCHISYSNIR